MAPPIFFVHRGPDAAARYAVLQAVSLGLDVHVIGDAAWADVPRITLHPIEAFDYTAAPFREVYRHVSVNDETYERFCFERWFMLLEAVRRLDLAAFHYADSDLLLFEGALDADLAARFVMHDTAWFNGFRGPGTLAHFCQFLLEVFSGDARLALAHKHAIGARPHLSDMHCLIEYGLRHYGGLAPLTLVGPLLGYDEALGNLSVHAPDPDCPPIKRLDRDGRGWSATLAAGGARQPMRTLHFQGRTKPLIQLYHTIEDPALLALLPDMRDWYENSGTLSAETAPMARKLKAGRTAA